MKNKIVTIIFLIFIYSFFIISFFVKKEDISKEERRKLASFPSFSWESLYEGDYTSALDKYIIDHFPLRNEFRKIYVTYNLKVLNKKDYKEYFVYDKYTYKNDYPLNEKKVLAFATKINNLYDKYLNNENNVYYLIIPDKTYYLKADYLKIDYDKLYKVSKEKINSNIKEIDIRSILNRDDYYYSDIHWKQEKLDKVVNVLKKNMKFTSDKISYNKKTYNSFYGSYYSSVPGYSNQDELIYLDSEYFKNVKISDLENKVDKVYQENKLGGGDSYDVYLGGAVSLIKIDNQNKNDGKRLIIFRDSFGSSLAPLLIPSYKEIVLIDIRYIKSDLLKDFVDFESSDILFMYNTSIINHSEILK